jgi:ribose transport system substrate-binding protein
MVRGALLGVSALALGIAVAPAGARAEDDPVVAEARRNVAERSGPQTVWDGPTTSPGPQPGKRIAYLSSNEANDASREWAEAVEAAGGKVGWEVTIIDGRGSPKTWLEGYNQAIALKVDGIITDADIASMQDAVREGARQGIVLVGIHGWAFPGPNKELGVYYNIQQDPREIGAAQADWIIAHSGGKARAVVTTHCEYQIACTKANATRDRLQQCKGCEVLELSNSPIAEVAQRQPALVTAWVQRYGTPLYITSVADYTADYQVPALRAGGVDPEDVILVSADGNRSAYERIRAGDQYQLVTASEPYRLQGYQAVDELNRAFHGAEPSGWHQKPYLVTPQNVNAEGGDRSTFIPGNDYERRYLEMWGVEQR